MTKISSTQLLVLATLAIAGSVSAKKQQQADDEFFSKAFGMVQVQSNHHASQWRDFLSTGPLPEAVEELIEDELDNFVDEKKDIDAHSNEKGNNNKDRELWWHDPWSSPHKRGWFSIDTDGDRALEVKNKNSGEECFSVGEGIGHDGWKFGITHGRVPDSNSTEMDTYLQLFEEWHPYMPVYKYFRGAKKLCIGEKSKENIAYLYIITDAGCYYLVGKPDSGRRDHLPKLKIRDQEDWRRQRKLRKKEGAAAGEGRELWSASDYNDHYDKTTGKYVVVRFRDGPGITNTFWQIWQNGFAKTTPNARWFFVPNAGGPTPEHPIEPDPNDDRAAICKATGGTVEYTMCTCETLDFFSTCSISTCGTPTGTACDSCVNPSPPRLNCYCKCPTDMCYNVGVGCVQCPGTAVPVPSF